MASPLLGSGGSSQLLLKAVQFLSLLKPLYYVFMFQPNAYGDSNSNFFSFKAASYMVRLRQVNLISMTGVSLTTGSPTVVAVPNLGGTRTSSPQRLLRYQYSCQHSSDSQDELTVGEQSHKGFLPTCSSIIVYSTHLYAILSFRIHSKFKYASHLASYLRLLTLSPSFSTSLIYNDSVQLALRTRRNALT